MTPSAVDRSDCPFCGYTSLAGEHVLRMRHNHSFRDHAVCRSCAQTIQAAVVAPLSRQEILAIAFAVKNKVAYGTHDIEDIVEAVGGDEQLVVEICEAADKANYRNPMNYFIHDWKPVNEARLKAAVAGAEIRRAQQRQAAQAKASRTKRRA